MTLSLDYKRDPYVDRDIKKISELQLQLSFKYLGSVNSFKLDKNSTKCLKQHCPNNNSTCHNHNSLFSHKLVPKAQDNSAPANAQRL